MSNSSRSVDKIWVKLRGTLLLADDPLWCENPCGTLPCSAPHEREVVDYLYELERCGARIFVYDPILAESTTAMQIAAQDYLYSNALNASAVAESKPPAGVEVIDEWPMKPTSTRDSMRDTNPATTFGPSSAKNESSGS